MRLLHMVDAARSAQRFLAGRQRADLDSDEMLRFAVVRAVEIIGEAASRVSPATRAQLSAVPWPAVIGMRNRMVHAYVDIDHVAVPAGMVALRSGPGRWMWPPCGPQARAIAIAAASLDL